MILGLDKQPQWINMFPLLMACLPHTKGKEPSAMKLTGGILFVDHCSKFISSHKQVFLEGGETVVRKRACETLVG